MIKYYSPGFKYKDLNGLVSNSITINLFEPKIGDEKDSLVLCLYCKTEKAANDLYYFIQKSPVESILDIETSLSQNKNNYWLLFLEFEIVRKDNGEQDIKKIARDVLYLLLELKGITGIKTWFVRFYGTKKYRKFSRKLLTRYLRLLYQNTQDS